MQMERLPLVKTPLAHHESYWRRLVSVPREIVPLSLMAFGGPPAHLALAHDRFVHQRKWLSDERFLEVLSIASALPGPSATQVLASMGLFRAGLLGGVVALIFWMLPGWIVMTIAGLGAKSYLQKGLPDWLSGLAPAAVSLVVIAAIRLWQKAIGDDLVRSIIASSSAFVVLATQGMSSLVFPSLMAIGGAITLVTHTPGLSTVSSSSRIVNTTDLQKQIGVSPTMGFVIVFIWLAVLLFFALTRPQDSPHSLSSMFFSLYWIGSIIFGGHQAMMPMLLHDFVQQGWVSKEQFLAGFAIVQVLPGPLFNISAYLGAICYGPIGALLGALGLFGPGVTLFFGLLPLWENVRNNEKLKVFLSGVNAAATGLVIASIFLLWEKAAHCNAHAAVGLATGLLVGVFKMPTTFAIIVGGILGYLLSPSILNLSQTRFQ